MRPAPSKSVTESWFGTASPPAASISSQTWAAGSSPMPAPSSAAPTSLTTTLAPAAAIAVTKARPMPRPEPVTTATRPSSSPTQATAAVAVPLSTSTPSWFVTAAGQVDEVLAALVALARDRRGAGERVARPHLLREADLEAAQGLGPEPVLHDAAP